MGCFHDVSRTDQFVVVADLEEDRRLDPRGHPHGAEGGQREAPRRGALVVPLASGGDAGEAGDRRDPGVECVPADEKVSGVVCMTPPSPWCRLPRATVRLIPHLTRADGMRPGDQAARRSLGGC